MHSAFREFHDSDVGKTVIVPLRYANYGVEFVYVKGYSLQVGQTTS